MAGRWDDLPPTNMETKQISKEKEMSEEIANARKTISKAFEDDPDFRRVYEANIAMNLKDRLEDWTGGDVPVEFCNTIADGLIKLIFEYDN